jgi:hypothetical protein
LTWLETGTSHPACGSMTKCSGPAQAFNASETKNKRWNRGFMYKWRGKLLLLRGRFRLLIAESKQGLLFIARFIHSQVDS